jgi:putative transposase
VRRAEDWRWSSLWRRECGTEAAQELLAEGPLPRPRRWAAWVNEALTAGELEAVRRSVARGQPYGSPAWVERTVAVYGLQPAMRARGRPRKQLNKGS